MSVSVSVCVCVCVCVCPGWSDSVYSVQIVLQCADCVCRVRFACREGTFRRLGQGHTERECFYNGTVYLSGSEIVCDRGQ